MQRECVPGTEQVPCECATYTDEGVNAIDHVPQEFKEEERASLTDMQLGLRS